MTGLSERVRTLKRAYATVKRANETYLKVKSEKERLGTERNYAWGIQNSCARLGEIVSEGEKQWREGILMQIEAEIAQALAFVYPNDVYQVKLVPRVLRGKLHIDSYVQSVSLQNLTGQMKRTQGLLFRQIVSVAAVMCIMKIYGVNTVYIDEAFSGSSVGNMDKARDLLKWYRDQGMNMIIIAQNSALCSGLDAHILTLRRSMDNRTEVEENEYD